MKFRLAVLILLFVPSVLSAQEKPCTPGPDCSVPYRVFSTIRTTVKIQFYPKHHWQEWASDWLLTGATVVDSFQTERQLNRCPACTEWNPLYGRRPSGARIWGESLSINFGQLILTRMLFHTQSTPLQHALSFLPNAIGTAFHSYGAVRNAGLK
jgi:hypothetical protein